MFFYTLVIYCGDVTLKSQLMYFCLYTDILYYLMYCIHYILFVLICICTINKDYYDYYCVFRLCLIKCYHAIMSLFLFRYLWI